MRDDIEGGIKNALERGYSLEQAVRSFINAGYKESEIREAASIFENQDLAMSSHDTDPLNHKSNPVYSPAGNPQPLPKGDSSFVVIILVIILILTIAALASTIIFRNELIAWIKNLL